MERTANKSKNIGLSVGTSSILVIFVLLCLTTFATLSMVSANADYKLTERAAEAVSDYYAADTAAEELLAGITAELEVFSGAVSGAEYQARAAEELPGLIPGLESELSPQGRALLRYCIPIGEIQELSVCLEVLDAPRENYVKRLEWKVLNLPDTSPVDEAIEGLWSGEDAFIPLDVER
jgi:hypothetical protein